MNIIITKKPFMMVFALLFIVNIAWSQTQTPLDAALRYIEDHHLEWNLQQEDIASLSVSDMYKSRHNDVTHIYFVQSFQDIEIYNAITSMHISDDGEVYNTAHRFISNLSSKVNATSPSISATDAVRAALRHLDVQTADAIVPLEATGQHEFLFSRGTFALNDIKVKLRYQPTEDGRLNLSWDLAIFPIGGSDYWSMRVDAQSGDVINQNSWTVHCKHGHGANHSHDGSCDAAIPHEVKTTTVEKALQQQNEAIAIADGTYNVFGQFINGVNTPIESPIHGAQNLLVDPHDLSASPYGWHDTDGAAGPEFTITRGNNVHAYLDENNTSVPSGEPDGGAALVFDFPYVLNVEPEFQQDLAVTNLFYMVNTIHDFAYSYGFDEAAGNFQFNSYGNGGLGGDHVLAEGQDGRLLNPPNLNNANMSTPPDGSNPLMQMYLWDSAGGRLATVNTPLALGGLYEAQLAGFGPPLDSVGLTGDVVSAFDDSADPTFACQSLINDNLVGKIALCDRGGCFFVDKVINAQEAGAIAVIVCNFEDSAFGMGGANADITIPSVMMKYSDCQLLRAFADGNGLNMTLKLPSTNGPILLDGDLDNGIIGHEFAHGISNRLTAGPSQVGCLGSGEQMGEGWSDFFTLATTAKAGDTGAMGRGIGNFAERALPTAGGIRRFPYSTDMTICPLTYNSTISNSGVHAVGEVWCNMIWDMYWAFVDLYGFNEDRTDMTAGNNIAIQLVMDGMKMQPCNPGFTDGRDAILAADNINHGGMHQCMIWEVFARRGLGYSADQGSSVVATDGIEAFDHFPICIEELKIAKTGTKLIDAGDEIEYTITVTNHKLTTATNVVVTDEIPAGCTYMTGSASNNGTASGGMVSWNLGDMPNNDVIVLTYKVVSDPNNPSIRQFFDDMEAGDDNWANVDLDDSDTPNDWSIADLFAYSGENSFSISDIDTESDNALLLFSDEVIQGTNPVLRFWHKYDTQTGIDGGFLEYSLDGATWTDMKPYFFKNSYRGPISYGTFVIPFLSAYSGESNDFIDSYVDLSSFAGETLLIRWRFGTDDTAEADVNEINLGWFVDDVEIMDMVSYNSEAVVTSDEGDMAVASLEGRGTNVNADGFIAAEDVIDPSIQVVVYPNPAQDVINVAINSERNDKVTLSLMSVDGRLINETNLTTTAGGTKHTALDVTNFAAGFYFVKVTTPKGIAIEKVVIK